MRRLGILFEVEGGCKKFDIAHDTLWFIVVYQLHNVLILSRLSGRLPSSYGRLPIAGSRDSHGIGGVARAGGTGLGEPSCRLPCSESRLLLLYSGMKSVARHLRWETCCCSPFGRGVCSRQL